jgi:hypothetical protein
MFTTGKKYQVCGKRGLSLLLAGILISTAPRLLAQPGTGICTMDAHLLRMAADSGYASRQQAIEEWILRQHTHGGVRGVLKIPVVVHIMHLPKDSIPSASSSNPTDAQILAAIDRLNDAFRHRGAYANGPLHSNAGIPGADTEIEFCLASTDPSGNAATGITRNATELSNLFRDDACATASTQDLCLKALNTWDPFRYLNIWLVNNICISQNSNACGLQGYTYLAGAHGQPWDGVVLKSAVWTGSSDVFPAAIHEISHYLNLFDTYQESVGSQPCQNNNCLVDGDKVCDTPPDAGPYGGACSSGEHINSCSSDADDPSASNPFRSDVEDLYENFLDGTEGGCRNSFTNGQKLRMRMTLAGPRASLLQQSACASTYTNVQLDAVIAPENFTCEVGNPQVRIVNTGGEPVTKVRFRIIMNGHAETFHLWSGSLASGDTALCNLPAQAAQPGWNRLQVSIESVNNAGSDDYSSDDFASKGFVLLPSQLSALKQPSCFPFEAASWPGEWVKANPDQQNTFEPVSYAACGDAGGQVLKYRASVNPGNSSPQSRPRDLMVSAPIDLRGYASASLSFDLAYRAAASGQSLSLRWWVISGCEAQPGLMFEKSGSGLASVAATTQDLNWTPLSCNDWRNETLDLTPYAGQVFYLVLDVELSSPVAPDLFLDNFCLKADGRCDLPSRIPEAPGVYQASRACQDAQGWVHYIKDAAQEPVSADDLLLFSLRDEGGSGLLLSPDEVRMVLSEAYGQGGHDLSGAGYVSNYLGWHVSARYLDLHPSQQPKDSVLLRFYYTATDLQDIGAQLRRPLESEQRMILFSGAPGVSLDPQAGHAGIGHEDLREYTNALQPGLRNWSWLGTPSYRAASFWASELGDVGLGSGGDGVGSGAFYPRRLLLEGEQKGLANRLNWSVELEKGVSGYRIFRENTLEGQYELLAEASQQSSPMGFPLQYEFRDHQPQEGLTRYYVQQTHFSGLEVYSDTVAIAYASGRVIDAFPNPTAGQVYFYFEQSETGEVPVELRLLTAERRELMREHWVQRAGQPHPVNLSELPPGIYFYALYFGENSGHELRPYWGKLIRKPE